jgi:hypothetical protein
MKRPAVQQVRMGNYLVGHPSNIWHAATVQRYVSLKLNMTAVMMALQHCVYGKSTSSGCARHVR